MSGTRIIAIRIPSNGTSEHHITDFKMDTGKEMPLLELLVTLAFDVNIFYTLEDGTRAEVTTGRTVDNKPYVKTKPDGTTANNLLSLPRF